MCATVLARPPSRDLTVEVRHVEEKREDGGVSYRAGSDESGNLMAPQKIQVRNGEKALLYMNMSVSAKWVETALAGSSLSGAGAKQTLQWFDLGQTIGVKPRWQGGNRDAVVEVEAQQATMVTGINIDLPSQSRSQFVSTVTAPLGQWVTIAVTGSGPARQGSYSSEGNKGVRRMLQLRVLVP